MRKTVMLGIVKNHFVSLRYRDMFKSCTKKYKDSSDERAFRFTFYCDCCGREVLYKEIEFTDKDTPRDTAEQKLLWKLLWQKEHSFAFGRADSEARESLFRCPCCFEQVCGDCVRGIETPDGSVALRCKRCGRKIPRSEVFGFTVN